MCRVVLCTTWKLHILYNGNQCSVKKCSHSLEVLNRFFAVIFSKIGSRHTLYFGKKKNFHAASH